MTSIIYIQLTTALSIVLSVNELMNELSQRNGTARLITVNPSDCLYCKLSECKVESMLFEINLNYYNYTTNQVKMVPLMFLIVQ